MVYDSAQIEKLKAIVGAFAAELDTAAMPYIDQGLTETVTLAEMSGADRAAGKPGWGLAASADAEPTRIFNYSDPAALRLEATALKRGGEYLASADKLIESFRLEGHFDLGNLRNLWKTTLCGGDARGAVALIKTTVWVYERYDAARRYEQLPYPPQDDLTDVLGALQTEQSCASRLRDFSGNPDYTLPRPYRQIVADLRGATSEKEAVAPLPTTPKSTGGCYIATAVYGSYDAPEVMVLREFRDVRLRRTVLGRTLIATYYALSPSLARRLPRHKMLSARIRRMLDIVVHRLRSKDGNRADGATLATDGLAAPRRTSTRYGVERTLAKTVIGRL